MKGGGAVPLEPAPGGYFARHVPGAGAGTLYGYRFEGEEPVYPDPASRYQPTGPHGLSQVVDPNTYSWTDSAWKGVPLKGQVIYEMHVGTFTREGTFAGAMAEFAELAAAGITVLELMPVAEFPGRFGWGYDGVDLFAPAHIYGTPDDLRRMVDHAHSAGLGVILDAVYNHIGPDGNYFKLFSEDYFTSKYENEWGEAINFDGENSGPVREFFIANAGYWIDEFHLDGLRLDATQSIVDASPEHVLAAIAKRAREAAGGRPVILVAENEPQHTKLVRPVEKGGYGLDALWNDDFHHSAMVAMTGRREAYYSDYSGSAQEFISAAKYGYLYQGQLYSWQGKRRGQPSFGLPPEAFVNYLQNHDQVANSGRGERCHALTSPGRYRAMTALLLLLPGTPLLFQGQEFAASSPFLYFADHKPELAAQVDEGRADFLAQFPSLALSEMRACFAKPHDRSTFERSKLDFADRERNAGAYRLHRDLLRLRREDRVFSVQSPGGLDGAALSTEAFVVRFFGGDGDDRLLLVNLGADLWLDPAPEPLLAPPEGKRWTKRWSSEEPRYGGCGYPAIETSDNWRVPGHAAAVLEPTDPTEDQLRKERRLEQETAARRKREKQEHA